MNLSHRLLPLLLLASLALPAAAQPSDEELGLYRALDGTLRRIEASYRPDSIAPDLNPGRRVTAPNNATGMNVDAAAEVLEALSGDRYRVRTNGSERVLSGRELRRLNLPYLIPDGATVLPGGSRWSGVSVTIDRANDPHLRAFLDKAGAIGAEPISDMEKIKRLTDLVNESLKYPGHETTDRFSTKIEGTHNGRAVPFGQYLEAGEGVCRHKAVAMKLALERVGIASRYVVGEALARETFAVRGGHAWVEALTTDGKRLLVDPTWHDPGITLEEAYLKGKLRRPKPDARRIIPPGRGLDSARAVDGPDLLSEYRRADGTVEWTRVPKTMLRQQALGAAHFAFALFLKELPAALATRDPARLEELADGLASVDFFVEYGLFSAGAVAGDRAFERLALGRAAKSRFVHGLMRTQVALATGLLLPQLVRGGFDGRAYVLDVAALGLSVAAVKTAAEALRPALRLRPLRAASTVVRGSVAGWIYSAAELAVILTITEEVSRRADAALAERAARRRLRDATEELLALGDDAPPCEVADRADAVAAAHDAWRAHLYAPVAEADARLFEEAARRGAVRVVRDDAVRDTLRERLGDHAALREFVDRRHGSVDGYLEGREGEARAAMGDVLAELEAARTAALRSVYEERRRGAPALADDAATRWALAGGVAGAPGDPGEGSLFGFAARTMARSGLLRRVGDPSHNRLEAYDDERALWELLAAARPAWSGVMAARAAEVDRLVALERELVLPLLPSVRTVGVTGALSEVGATGR